MAGGPALPITALSMLGISNSLWDGDPMCDTKPEHITMNILNIPLSSIDGLELAFASLHNHDVLHLWNQSRIYQLASLHTHMGNSYHVCGDGLGRPRICG